MNDLLTTNQVQSLLQVDRTTIYRMVETGRLPAIRVGKQWRFSRPDIESWLQTQSVSSSSDAEPGPLDKAPHVWPASRVSGTQRSPATCVELRDLLPTDCVQLIQDAFAEILGVMMVITDNQGMPLTKISNPCGFYSALTQAPDPVKHCMHSWQGLAASQGIAPRFMPSEMGLMCARGLIRVESELKGMVILGGIAPDIWPPTAEQVVSLAATFDQSPGYILTNANAVHHLDRAGREKALRAVQSIADIFAHVASDRHALCGRLQAIASLTVLQG